MTRFDRWLRRGGAPAGLARISRVSPTAADVAPPTVTWANADAPPLRMACPNCGARRGKPLLLTVHFATPDHPLRHSRVVRCPDCTCAFYEDQNPPDYTEASMLGRGRVAFYLQQGAGISLITRPLAQVNVPPGANYLEVGCGFGFGLDFATKAKGWHGSGIDPGEIAGLGRDMLGITIEQRYLGNHEPALAGTGDVVMASETIEHVRSPIGFVRTLRRSLRSGGVLILTTPDGADLRPDSPPGALVGLLSPGLHLVFQNEASLRSLLGQAGFAHHLLSKDGHSLVAFASDAPIALETRESVLREAYRGYLERRAADFAPEHDLYLCFAGRALHEAVNDADFDQADRIWGGLVDACRRRFGLEIDTMTDLPEEARHCSLERMAGLMPLSLGTILNADAMRRLGRGAARLPLEARLLCAAEAADALRHATGQLAMEDAMSERIAWSARAEALLCAAVAGDARVPSRLAALAGCASEPELADRLAERVVASLVDLRNFDFAEAAVASVDLGAAAWARTDGTDPPPLSETERDALISMAILDARRAETRGRGASRFARVRVDLATRQAADRSPRELYWSALRGEVEARRKLGEMAALDDLLDPERHGGTLPSDLASLAHQHASRRLVPLVNEGRYDAAGSFARRLDAESLLAMPPSRLTAEQRNVLFALAVLAGRRDGEAAEARRRFAAVRNAFVGGSARVDPLYWSALRGEAIALRQTGATPLEIEALLDPRAHGGALPDDLAAMADAAKTSALVDLVNAGRYEEARPLAHLLADAPFARPPYTFTAAHHRDAVFALAVLDARPGGDTERALARFRAVRASLAGATPAADALAGPALQGEIDMLRRLERYAALEDLLADDPPAADAAAEVHERNRALRIVDLVNAGAYAQARSFVDRLGSAWQIDADCAPLPPHRRDALFAFAVLDMQQGGDAAASRRRFAAVRRSLLATVPPGVALPELYWSALRGELQGFRDNEDLAAVRDLLDPAAHGDRPIPADLTDGVMEYAARQTVSLVNAGEFAAASPFAALLEQSGFADRDGATDPVRRDAAFALGMLDLQRGGDRHRAQRRFAAVQAVLLPGDGPVGDVPELYWSALRGNVIALAATGRSGDATALVRMAADRLGAGSGMPADLRERLTAPAIDPPAGAGAAPRPRFWRRRG